MGERRRGGQRQDQEGAGERDQPRCRRGAERTAVPERPPLEGRARRASASPGPGVASRPPPSLVPPAQRRRGSSARAAVFLGQRTEAAAAQRPGESTRRGRGLASITADLPRPPCWEETTRHAAAERLQRRKRRWRCCLPRAAAAPGGKGRRVTREERPEPQRYGGPAGSHRLLRSPAGRRGAWRASCGAEPGT